MEYMGCSYHGPQNARKEMSGIGEYRFSTGSVYKGGIKDGKFHGIGILHLTNGTEFRGTWKDGEVVKGQLVFSDGLNWQADGWNYCTPEDRRFHSEKVKGLKPAGQSQLKDKLPPPKIPDECYDTGDGFYDYKEHVVTDYKGRFLRYANDEEHQWIMMKCRKGWDEIVGKNVEETT